MPMFDVFTSAINPYLLYAKIAAFILAASVIIGGYLYISRAFSEKNRLTAENKALLQNVEFEQKKYEILQQQTENILEMNSRIVEGIKNVRINSQIRVEQIEKNPLPTPINSGSVFISAGRMPETVSTSAGMSRFKGYSSGRTATVTQGG